jgi:hypothetical protein
MFDIKKISIILLVTILIVACKNFDKNESSIDKLKCNEWINTEWTNSDCIIYEGINNTSIIYIASIYALLSNPKFFDKKQVSTCGYLSADISIENLSIEYILYPHKEDFLYNLPTNALKIEILKDERKILKNLAVPFEKYICLNGLFSQHIGHRRFMSYGFINAETLNIYNKSRQNLKNEEYQEIRMLNEKLDSLIKEGLNPLEIQIAPLREFFPYPSFEIRGGKLKSSNLRGYHKKTKVGTSEKNLLD